MGDSSFSLDRWEWLALARVPEGLEVLNALRPQKNFRYPDFPPFALGEELTPQARFQEIARVFRTFAHPSRPRTVHIHRNLTLAVEDWLRRQGLGGQRVGLTRPAPAEFITAATSYGCPVVFLPRDPEDLIEALEQDSRLGAILISQPSRVDGFYLPDETYAHLIEKILAKTSAKLLSEESNYLFTLNEIPPGVIKTQERCFALRSLMPALSPQGPSVSWWFGSDADAPLPESLSVEELHMAARALLAFQSRQGQTYSEFQRKILLVDKGLRGFADALKPAILSKHCRVPLWPESGFHMLLEIQALKQGREPRDFCLELAARHGLIVAPGDAFGAPDCIQICFAGLPNWLERLGCRLATALQDMPALGVGA